MLQAMVGSRYGHAYPLLWRHLSFLQNSQIFCTNSHQFPVTQNASPKMKIGMDSSNMELYKDVNSVIRKVTSQHICEYSYSGSLGHSGNQYVRDCPRIPTQLNVEDLDKLFQIEKQMNPIQTIHESDYEPISNKTSNVGVLPDIYVQEVLNAVLLNSEIMQPISQIKKRRKHISCDNIVYFSSNDPLSGKENDKDQNKPTYNQLHRIKEHLIDYIPEMLNQRMDLTIHTKDVILENNFTDSPSIVKGIVPYSLAFVKFRLWLNWIFARAVTSVLRAECQEEAGTVRVQWRVEGVPQNSVLYFWRFRPGHYKEEVSSRGKWVEGISTFYVNGDGLVYKHRVDRVVGDEHYLSTKKTGIIRKIVNAINPKPVLGSGSTACK